MHAHPSIETVSKTFSCVKCATASIVCMPHLVAGMVGSCRGWSPGDGCEGQNHAGMSWAGAAAAGTYPALLDVGLHSFQLPLLVLLLGSLQQSKARISEGLGATCSRARHG